MNEEKKIIAILLSTYNGALYIEEQLNSIINQTYKNWQLYVRDDGSKDNTIDLINKYAEKDNRIHIIFDSVSHRGPKDSFIWLLHSVTSDYYMFCDQDDFWMPSKIEDSVHALENVIDDIPVVACCDLFLVDKKLRILHESMWKAHHLNKLVNNPDGLRIASMFPGCTMIFNELAKKYTVDSKYNFPMHDIQLSMSVLSNNGKIIPINKSLIKYRLHDCNVVGLYSGNNWFRDKVTNILKCYRDNKAYYKISRDNLGTSLLEYFYLKVKHIINSL